MGLGRPKDYLHDEISTDKRNPTVNANGLIFGATEESTDLFPVLDPINHKATQVKMPVRDPKTPSSKDNATAPSPYWGDEIIWDSKTSMHNPMFDEKGRVWFTSRVRSPDNPAFCKKGSEHPSAMMFPLERSNRQLSMYEPETGKITLISTCFQTHHLVFAEDANNTLWTSAGGPQSGVIGWLNRKMFEETGDEEKSQGWTALMLDTNGNGKRDDYVEPNEPVDPAKDKRINAAIYSVARKSGRQQYLGHIARLSRLRRPPQSRDQIHRRPLWRKSLSRRQPGYGPAWWRHRPQWRVLGILIERPSRQLRPAQMQGASERAQCDGKTLSRGLDAVSVSRTSDGRCDGARVCRSELLYLGRPIRHVRSGKNVPIATGNANESLLALVDGKFVNLRVPYPMGFYSKWMDGRVDDANAGWKGKAIWATYSTRTPFHIEGGKGTTSKVVKLQLRPDPLAR